jgi:hypothetical protein
MPRLGEGSALTVLFARVASAYRTYLTFFVRGTVLSSGRYVIVTSPRFFRFLTRVEKPSDKGLETHPQIEQGTEGLSKPRSVIGCSWMKGWVTSRGTGWQADLY